MPDNSPAPDASNRKLLDDLERISATLEPGAQLATPDPADIPVLIDIVSIPILAERVDGDAPAAGDHNDMELPSSEALRTELEIESAFIVDDLVEEFLPQLEALLRDRLEQRRRQLLSTDDDASNTDVG